MAPSSIKPNHITTESAACVLLAELVHAAARVDDLLLARIERMTRGTDFDLQIVTERRASLEDVAATARDGDFFVLRMDAGFHKVRAPQCPSKRPRSVAACRGGRNHFLACLKHFSVIHKNCG